MKKYLLLIIAWVICPCLLFSQVDNWDGTAVQWTNGTGTATDPYLIESAEHLAKLAQNVNSGTTYSGQYFKLTTDLNLKNRRWTPIGLDTTKSFQGTFDGDNHFIDSLYYNGTSYRYVGLFGCVKNATLTQINVRANIIHNFSTTSYTGGICGYAYTHSSGTITISNCSNSGNISVSSISSTGGICGYAYAHSSGTITISNCSNSGNISVSSTSSSSIGGICGEVNARSAEASTISECSNSGTLTGGNYIGGICGYAVFTYSSTYSSKTMTIYECSNSGTLTGGNIGGICGDAWGITIRNSSNSGTLTGGIVGGICGRTGGVVMITISECSNTGALTARTIVGGICGYARTSNGFYNTYGTMTISKCLNSGTISSTSSSTVIDAGGICGWAETSKKFTITISECSNSGNISATSSGRAYAGGICSFADFITTSNCSNSGTISSTSSSADAYAGGICGWARDDIGVVNCYNVGNITSQGTNSNTYGIGGGSVKNCYNAGTLTGTNKIGCDTNVTNCYYIETCGANTGGTPKTDIEMKDISFPALLNTDSVVFIMDITPNINKGYPIFGTGIYVQTGDADNIQGTFATLHGNYYAETVTSVGFEYKPANETNFVKIYTTIGAPASYNLSGLMLNTTYDYRFFIEKDSIIYRGEIKQFTTHCNLSVTISGDLAICQGESTTLTASGANSYVWSDNSTNATLTTSTAGTYTVTGTDANGCEGTSSVNVVVYPTYNKQISHSIYQGASYNFYGQSLTTEGVYTHTLTSAQGCDSVITLTLMVYLVQGDQILCLDKNIALQYGACDTLLTLTPPLYDDQYFSTNLTITSSVSNPIRLGEGTHNIEWTLVDNDLNITRTCTQTITITYPPCGETLTDIEGNSYNTVRLGCECWMAENLRATKYSNGNNIANYRAYQNDDALANIYGLLYSWYSAANVPEGNNTAMPTESTTTLGKQYVQGACPAGWALPTEEDYLRLEGLYADVNALKSTETTTWLPGHAGIAPVSGFDAKAAGYYNIALERYEEILGTTYFWTRNCGPVDAGVFGIRYHCESVLHEQQNKGNGCSIRCLRRE